ncbi:hypothetical protein ACELLULO517_15630 [Acidisoma cellulosilytica]|uniref:DNA primase/polymerase bifunctional N-terminal domain-containing protein n=1 Tax=Acidisoma cellulosilyticum TaxID=2802395 RepID=A0A963Z4M1_9PROT|nr:hypothetical protein [Acidisoma cellulosilyticum]MCB8881678.1 hypothetical protein [Acidisoma cellulosilyticum]
MSDTQKFVNTSASIGIDEGVELLNGMSESVFAGVAQNMVDLGWSIFPQMTSGERRLPGKIDGGVIKWKEDYNLSLVRPTQDFLDRCIYQCASLNVATVFGPASGNTFAVDIDVLDEKLADEVAEIAEEILGDTPFVRVGNKPKLALIYRHAEDDVVASVSRRLADEEGMPSQHGLEILGAGKLLTFHGRHHKTGQYFKWTGLATPLLDGPEKALLVTSAQVVDFLAAVDTKLGFAQAQVIKANFSWTEGEEGEVRTAIIDTGVSGRLTDGREEYLGKLVWAMVCANSQEICAARDLGDDALRPLLAGVCQAVFDEFVVKAEASGRWEPKMLRQEIRSRVARAAAKVEPPRPRMIASGASKSHLDSDLPIIEIVTGDVESAANAAELALVASGRGIYQRGGAIVSIGETWSHTASGREVSTQRIFPVGEHALVEHLSASAIWMKYDARSKGMARTSAPMWIAQTLMDRKGRLGLPVLSGVVGAPTLRGDGSILDQPGFDETTGLLLDHRGVQFPEVPQAPSRDDALVALGALKALIKDFPFVANADRSVALSMLLTACVRRSLRTAPLHAFSAPTAGTGKSKLVDIASILATGREAGVLAQGKTDEETEKRLASALIAGDQIITLDNCVLPVDGDLLCQMLTQSTVRPRILGRSETPDIPASALMAATGNSLIIAGDVTRRAIYCSLDAKVERPEDREFDIDVIAETKKRRPELVVAALTVLRAFIVEGSPKQKNPLGSFEDWSRTVRDALVWAGEADPCETMVRMRELDPKLEALTAVLSGWAKALNDNRVTTSAIVEAATAQAHNEDGQIVFRNPELRSALMSVASAGSSSALSARSLGRWLGANADRRVGGLRIVRLGLLDGSPTWRLESDEPGILGPANW